LARKNLDKGHSPLNVQNWICCIHRIMNASLVQSLHELHVEEKFMAYLYTIIFLLFLLFHLFVLEYVSFSFFTVIVYLFVLPLYCLLNPCIISPFLSIIFSQQCTRHRFWWGKVPMSFFPHTLLWWACSGVLPPRHRHRQLSSEL
jgi:hypothetical protein